MAVDTEEVWQGYNEQGEPSGKPLTKLECRHGALHGAIHVWVWRRAGDSAEVLLQQRSQNVLTWPGYNDISAAGHIDFGEQPLQTAMRETAEELGLVAQAADLRFIAVHRTYGTVITGDGSEVYDNELVWLYLYELKGDGQLRYTDGEVSAHRWVSVDELEKATVDAVPGVRLVPHGNKYWTVLLEELKRHI